MFIVNTRIYVYMFTGVGSGGGGQGACAPPPTFERGGGGAQICLCPPHFQTQNLGLGIEPTDICDVTLAWLASRCWARQMCPPPFCHVPTPLMLHSSDMLNASLPILL